MFSSALVQGAVLAAACLGLLWGGAGYGYLAVFAVGMLTASVQLGGRVVVRTLGGLLAVLALAVLEASRHAPAEPSLLQTAQHVVAAGLAAATLMRLPMLAEARVEAIADRS